MVSEKNRIFLGALLLFCLSFWMASDEAGVSPVEKKPKQGKEAGMAGGFGFTSSNEPITIRAATLEVDYRKNRILYKGGVEAVQGNTTIQSDTLTAEYLDGFKQLKEAIAEGHVRIKQAERVASSGKAVFDQTRGSVVMTGNPIVRQGASEVSGERITFYLEDERTVVEGGNQRVKAIIHPEELKGTSP
jgi:lipopolysaccharide export system protein LptA